MRARVFGVCLAAIALLGASACTAGVDDAHDSTAALEAVVPAHLDTADEGQMVRAVLVEVGGERIYELWQGEDARDFLNIRSITKSIVATLVGIAIDRGELPGVDATLGELLPEYRALMDEEVAAIPMSAILTHTAGFAPGGAELGIEALDDYTSTDWVATIIADRVARGPGDGSFAYSNVGAHLLAAIVDEATDGTLLDFAREALFVPLGIPTEPAWVTAAPTSIEELPAQLEDYLAADFAWPADPQGINAGDGGIKLTPEHLVSLGQLYLAGGEVGGDRVVSREWIDAATTTHTETHRDPPGYGYQWATGDLGGEPAYFAIGIHGNVIAVVPGRELVVVVASAWPITSAEVSAAFRGGEALTLIEFVILPALDGKLVTSSSRG